MLDVKRILTQMLFYCLTPAQKPKSHQPAPKIEKTTGRDKPVVGRIICEVGQAEQRACFGWKGQGQEDVEYDTSAYWDKGGGSLKVQHACRAHARAFSSMHHLPALTSTQWVLILVRSGLG